MRTSIIGALALTVLSCGGAAQAQATGPLHRAALAKLEQAAEVCRQTDGKPGSAFAQAAAQAGFTEKPERSWWQWDSGIVGPSMIVTQLPERCRIVLIPDGLSREQVSAAVFGWADRVGFEVVEEPPSSDAEATLVTGYLDGLSLTLWTAAQGNFLLDFD